MKQDHSYIAIEIENSKLAPFLDLEKGKAVKNVHLTTMVDNQRRAYIKVFLIMPGRKVLLKEFDLTSLPPKPAGPPRFVLMCSFDGIHSLTIDLRVDGKAYRNENISLRKYLRRSRPWLIALITLAALLLLAAVLLVPRSCGSSRSATPPKSGSITAAPADKAKPAAKPAPAQAEPAAPAAKPAPVPPAPAEPAEPVKSTPPAAETAQKPAAAAAETRVVKPAAVSRELIIYFNPNDTRLTEEAQKQLEQFGNTISAWERVSLSIEGHCALSGTEEGREELSRERAEKSADFLRRAGAVDAEDISVSWYAGERPVTRDPERQELNRRAVLSARGEEAAR